MLLLTYTAAGITKSLNAWVDWTSVTITDQLNVPTTLTFKLINKGTDFPILLPHTYITLYSTRWKRSLYTGYVNSAPVLVPLGSGPYGTDNAKHVVFQWAISCTSDEFLINIKSVQFIPAFINQTQGDILRAIADTLCPGIFNTDYIQNGDIVPYFSYDPSQSWSEIAKTFADGIRYRYKVRDKIIWFVPYGDAALGINYDENVSEATYDPYGLKTNVFQVPMVNDITIIGAVEAGNNREDYVIGDGFTGNFPLRHKVFEGAATLLLNDDWTEAEFDNQQWYVADPAGQFNLGNGALNIVSSFAFPLGESFLQLNNGLELAGGLDVEHGEFGWNDFSEGTIGGVYSDETMSASACIAYFAITSPIGVELTASGAVGVVMQPMYGDAPVGLPVISQANHTYVLQTLFNAPTYSRYLQQYRTLKGSTFGGAQDTMPGDITFIIQDTDIAAATGLFYVPVVSKVVVNNAPLPAFAVYGPINNIRLNCTVNFTLVAKMPLGTLQAWEGPLGLWMPTGIILPHLPPGNGGYIGPVIPWPGNGSGAIFPPPLRRTTLWSNEVMGNGFEQQAAQVTAGNSADTLAFYAQSLPAAGTPVRYQSWEAQAAIARLQDANSIASEAILVGDDGIRAAIVSNLNPLPRTSEDCDNAALAYLEDRTRTWYNGTYTCTSYFLNQFTNDPVFWPIPGRYLWVNTPFRGITNENMLVSQVVIKVADAVGNPQYSLTNNPTQVGEVLVFQLAFGPDLHLEKVLANFNDTNPPSILTPQDRANPINPRVTTAVENSFLPDVKSMMVYPIKDAVAGVQILDGYTFPLEVRLTDANWGQGATPNFVGSYTNATTVSLLGAKTIEGGTLEGSTRKGLVIGSGGTTTFGPPKTFGPPHTTPHTDTGVDSLYGPTLVNFELQRQQYDQTWYMRYVQDGVMSRRNKVVRIVYPQKPAPPKIDSADSHYVQFDFAGDIRSIFGFELRALDNTTIIIQKPIESLADLLIDLTTTKATFPFTPVIETATYLNASGNMAVTATSPWGGDSDILWSNFRVTSTMPSDAQVLAIYPVVQVASYTRDGTTIHSLAYDTSSPITGPLVQQNAGVHNNYRGGEDAYGDFDASFSTPVLMYPAQGDGDPISIGNQLSDIVGRSQGCQFRTSLYQGGPGLTPLVPLADQMTISAVGFAIYYTSETLPTIDPQMPQPFNVEINPSPGLTIPPADSPPAPLRIVPETTIPNLGVAWALPFAAAAYAYPGAAARCIFCPGHSTASASGALLVPETGVSREFLAYFFNHQWSYSNPTILNIPAPDPPVLQEASRFGQTVNVLSDILTRTDIIYQRWQVANTEDFTDTFLDVTNNYQQGSFVFNAPASADVFVRSVRSDFISSGAWSDPLQIPVGDLISSNFLAAQGSVLPVVVGSSGSLITYTSTFDLIVVNVAPFSIQYPDGSIFNIPAASQSNNTTLDTDTSLAAGSGYLFYFSIPTPTTDPAPTVDIDGPYLNPSTSALAFTIADGRIPLTQGALTFFTATTSTGTGGGGGGGTGGGGACGVPSSQIKMADGSWKPLAALRVGDSVDDGQGGIERVKAIQVVEDTVVHTLCLSSGKRTRCGLAHTLYAEHGWEPLCDIMADQYHTGIYTMIDTVDGPERILDVYERGWETVIMLQLEGPQHTYILDGIKTHNALFKGL